MKKRNRLVRSFAGFLRAAGSAAVLAGVCVPGGIARAQTNPGDYFAQRRAELVAKHDRNGDGRLDERERMIMRSSLQPLESKWRRGGGGGAPRQGEVPPLPQSWLESYDQDKDGKISYAEFRTGLDTERRLMARRYDADRDQKLSRSEADALRRDLESGRFEGIDVRVVQGLLAALEFEPDPNPRPRPRQEQWLQHDRDRDGKASAAELEAIRSAAKGKE